MNQGTEALVPQIMQGNETRVSHCDHEDKAQNHSYQEVEMVHSKSRPVNRQGVGNAFLGHSVHLLIDFLEVLGRITTGVIYIRLPINNTMHYIF